MIGGGFLRRRAIEALLEGLGVPKEYRGKVAEAVNKFLEENTMEPKAGIRTTEFWLHIFFSLGTLLETLSGAIPAKYALAAILASGCFYSLARGLAKQGGTGVGGVTVQASETRGAGSTVVVAAPTEVSK